jgi:hypothetical protein
MSVYADSAAPVPSRRVILQLSGCRAVASAALAEWREELGAEQAGRKYRVVGRSDRCRIS